MSSTVDKMEHDGNRFFELEWLGENGQPAVILYETASDLAEHVLALVAVARAAERTVEKWYATTGEDVIGKQPLWDALSEQHEALSRLGKDTGPDTPADSPERCEICGQPGNVDYRGWHDDGDPMRTCDRPECAPPPADSPPCDGSADCEATEHIHGCFSEVFTERVVMPADSQEDTA